MSAKNIALMCMIACGVLLFGIIIFAFMIKKRVSKQTKTIDYTKNKRNNVYFLYKIYNEIPLLKKYYAKIETRYEGLYPADFIAVNVKTTKTMTKAIIIALLCGLSVIIMSLGDFFYCGIGVVLVYVVFTQIISMSIDKLETTLNLQLSDWLADVRHYYHDTKDVADAVYCTLDEVPYELGLHISKIYNVLLSTHVEKDVAKYEEVAPNRFLKTLAAICASIKEYGDTRMDDGQWLFLKNLNYLKEEVNIDILKKTKNKALFSGLVFISVSPMLLLKPIEIWATKNIPEMASFYTGGGGTITMAVTFVLTIISYTMVCSLKDGRRDSYTENKFLNNLASTPFISGLLTAEINRNYSKSLRIADDLKIVGDKLTPKSFLLKRLLYGIIACLIANIIIFTVNVRSRDNAINDFSEAYESSIVPNQDYREEMRSISQDYANMSKRLPDTGENREYLKSELIDKEGVLPQYATLIVAEIFTHINKYQNIYYKWWMLIISLITGLIGFFIPYLLMKYQLSIMKMNMEDEVIQFQTLALILMHVDGMTVDILLEWMDRFAFCFKDSINECITNLEYSIQGALKKMKKNEPFPPFKRFVDNMLSIDEVGIVSAFDEIESEREYYQKKREQDNNIIIEKKAGQGKIIAFIPLISAIGLHMILPFMMMAVEMMSTMNDALTSL